MTIVSSQINLQRTPVGRVDSIYSSESSFIWQYEISNPICTWSPLGNSKPCLCKWKCSGINWLQCVDISVHSGRMYLVSIWTIVIVSDSRRRHITASWRHKRHSIANHWRRRSRGKASCRRRRITALPDRTVTRPDDDSPCWRDVTTFDGRSWRTSASSDGVHQRSAAGAGEGIPQQEVSVTDWKIAARSRPTAQRGIYKWPNGFSPL